MNYRLKIFLVVFNIISYSYGYSQMKNVILQVKGYVNQEVKVGESMPDIPLRTVLNNKEGLKKISELKGKLVILDFWDTWCGSCIGAFPKMDQLQKQFGDKIQIILVNTAETEEAIQERFRKIPALKKLKMPDLLSIVNAKKLDSLFPHESVPYHVWIDETGIVRFKGSHLNTHEEKIKRFLEGKQVGFINGRIKYDGSEPLNAIAKSYLSDLKYSSQITGFTDEVKDFFGNQAFVNKVDSGRGTIRNTYVNRDLAQLYVDAAEDKMDSVWKQNLNIRGGAYLGKFDLIVKDTLKYTWRFLPPEKWTDEIIRKSKFCYEQITPLNLPISKRKEYMLEDLNRYFGSLYGVTGVIKMERKSCYVLVRISKVDKLKAKDEQAATYFTTIDGEKIKNYRSFFLKDILKNIVYESKEGNNKRDIFNPDDILIDGTGYLNKVDISLPYVFEGGIKNLDELRAALRDYDLDIVLKERDVQTLVLKEN